MRARINNYINPYPFHTCLVPLKQSFETVSQQAFQTFHTCLVPLKRSSGIQNNAPSYFPYLPGAIKTKMKLNAAQPQVLSIPAWCH